MSKPAVKYKYDPDDKYKFDKKRISEKKCLIVFKRHGNSRWTLSRNLYDSLDDFWSTYKGLEKKNRSGSDL